MAYNYSVIKCAECESYSFHLGPKPPTKPEAIVGAPCAKCGTLMAKEEFKRQRHELSVRAAKEPSPRLTVYGIRYFREDAMLRIGIPLAGPLEQTLEVARLGLTRHGADLARIVDIETGAETASVRHGT